MVSVLFVCTGNICRSPTADAVLRHMAGARGLDVTVDSAGTHGYHIGNAPDRRAIDVAGQNGIDMTYLRARQLAEADFEDFDYLIAMDASHLEIMRRIGGAPYADKIRLFLDTLPGHEGRDVPDPYYGTLDDFGHVFDLVHKGCDALLKSLQE